MDKKKILNKIGELIIKEVRDNSYEDLQMKIDGKYKSNKAQEITKNLSRFSKDEIEIIKKTVLSSLDSSLHYFLWMIEQSDDFDLVAREDGKIISLKEISDGLCGELYTEEGWIMKYSKYPPTTE